MEDSQAAACSWQSPGTRTQLRPAASCLLCSTQALFGQKSCTINPVLMWPGMVTALPVTAGTARLRRPSLLRWVVSLKTLLFYTGWGTRCLCASSAMQALCGAFCAPAWGDLFFPRDCDVPECFPEHVSESGAVQTLRTCSTSLCRWASGLMFVLPAEMKSCREVMKEKKKICLKGSKLSTTHFSSRFPGKNPVSDF